MQIEIRASIEALLSGINARFKNTKQAPTVKQYDGLRILNSEKLHRKFKAFENNFLDLITLRADGQKVGLKIDNIAIPPPGYTKVPRISIIKLNGPLARSTNTLQLYYPAKFGDSAIRVRQVDEKAEKWHWSEWQWIKKDQPSRRFSLADLFTRQPVSQVIASYITLGFKHILPRGLDHILFILGLFLLSIKLRPLLWQVTMFTIAHTITLGLAMAGIVELPARIVEPLIALSIAYVGIENIFAKTLHVWRLVLVFGFGLLHGLGFASVLADFGMPRDAFMTALISFNIGVEFGQITIILLAFFTLAIWFRHKSWYRSAIIIPASALISLIGLYWTLERLEWI